MKTIHEPAYRLLVSELRQARVKSELTQTAAGRLMGHNRNWIHKEKRTSCGSTFCSLSGSAGCTA